MVQIEIPLAVGTQARQGSSYIFERANIGAASTAG